MWEVQKLSQLATILYTFTHMSTLDKGHNVLIMGITHKSFLNRFKLLMFDNCDVATLRGILAEFLVLMCCVIHYAFVQKYLIAQHKFGGGVAKPKN